MTQSSLILKGAFSILLGGTLANVVLAPTEIMTGGILISIPTYIIFEDITRKSTRIDRFVDKVTAEIGFILALITVGGLFGIIAVNTLFSRNLSDVVLYIYFFTVCIVVVGYTIYSHKDSRSRNRPAT